MILAETQGTSASLRTLRWLINAKIKNISKLEILYEGVQRFTEYFTERVMSLRIFRNDDATHSTRVSCVLPTHGSIPGLFFKHVRSTFRQKAGPKH